MPDYPLKNGRPTSKGIKQYVEEQSDSLVIEFQNFIDDTIYNIWIYAEDLTRYSVNDSLELGRYYPHEIFISTAEMFLAYELGDLSQEQRDHLVESNRFVKAAMIHELTHDYINQISVEMRSIDKIRIDRSYQTSIWIVRSPETFGSTFIEEGLCEYMVEKMGELIPPERPFIPKSVQDITNGDNRYEVNYKYASFFLKTYLDTTGFKKGVKILLHNPPPSYDEILQPNLFFTRLNSNLEQDIPYEFDN